MLATLTAYAAKPKKADVCSQCSMQINTADRKFSASLPSVSGIGPSSYVERAFFVLMSDVMTPMGYGIIDIEVKVQEARYRITRTEVLDQMTLMQAGACTGE